MEHPHVRMPPEVLTVVIRNDGPLAVCGSAPTYRSVRVCLTQEQREKLTLRYTHTSGGRQHFESIAQCFIEPEPDDE